MYCILYAEINRGIQSVAAVIGNDSLRIRWLVALRECGRRERYKQTQYDHDLESAAEGANNRVEGLHISPLRNREV
jgi:hypothetical protein